MSRQLDLEAIEGRIPEIHLPRDHRMQPIATDLHALVAEVKRLRVERDIAIESARHHAAARGLTDFNGVLVTPADRELLEANPELYAQVLARVRAQTLSDPRPPSVRSGELG